MLSSFIYNINIAYSLQFLSSIMVHKNGRCGNLNFKGMRIVLCENNYFVSVEDSSGAIQLTESKFSGNREIG